jgi:hypothetical protein
LWGRPSPAAAPHLMLLADPASRVECARDMLRRTHSPISGESPGVLDELWLKCDDVALQCQHQSG